MAQAPIDSFQGEYRWLSNFHEQEVKMHGIFYPTNEHAFQALKADSLAQRLWVFEAKTPGEAKRRGQKVKMRADWDEVRLKVMMEINRDKFRNPGLRDRLLETGERELIEGNTWGDRFWGVCDGKGENHLGKILMRVRTEMGG